MSGGFAEGLARVCAATLSTSDGSLGQSVREIENAKCAAASATSHTEMAGGRTGHEVAHAGNRPRCTHTSHILTGLIAALQNRWPFVLPPQRPVRSFISVPQKLPVHSESVSEGIRQVANQIADAILVRHREHMKPESRTRPVNTRLGCETLTPEQDLIAGEGRGQAPLFTKHGDKAVVNREMIAQIARDVVKDIGYDQDGFSFYGADVEVLLHGQSPDIAMGVDAKKKKDGEQEGAGDQGMMFGFACTETRGTRRTRSAAPIFFAHKILKVLSDKRRSGQLFDLQPDAKSQVTVQYVDGKAVGCTKVVVSTQHNEKSRNGKKYTPGMVKELIGAAVESALPKGWMPKKASDFLVNRRQFVIGGTDGGLRAPGRKS